MSESRTSPASGQSDAIQKVTLVRFTATESGWVAAERAPQFETVRFNIWPIIGYAHWEVTSEDGSTWDDVTACVSLTTIDRDAWEATPRVYFSRQLFREAQSGDVLTLSEHQLMRAVSE